MAMVAGVQDAILETPKHSSKQHYETDEEDDAVASPPSLDKKKSSKRAKQPTVKGAWSKDEDNTVSTLVSQYGPKRWSLIASNLPGRTGKQCRERWHNQLDPGIKKEGWTDEEDRILVQAHAELGNQWVHISKLLPGRTDNAIKNRVDTRIYSHSDPKVRRYFISAKDGTASVWWWNSTVRKRLVPSSPDRDGAAPGGGVSCPDGGIKTSIPVSSISSSRGGKAPAKAAQPMADSTNKRVADQRGVAGAGAKASEAPSKKQKVMVGSGRPTGKQARSLGDSMVETIGSFGTVEQQRVKHSPLSSSHLADSPGDSFNDSPMPQDDTVLSGNTTLLDGDSLDASCNMRTPSCYSSMRKGMRPIDSEMRRNRFKDTAHVLFSPPSKSAAPSEGDVLAGGATLPTSGGTPLPTSGGTPLPTSGGTPIPHTGFTPGQGCNFSPSTFLLTSPSANTRNSLSGIRPLTHSKFDAMDSMLSPVGPIADFKEVRRPILFSPGGEASSEVPSLSTLLIDSNKKQ